MRLNKFFITVILAVSTLSLQSCLKDQEDIFDDSSSIRMQEVLDNAKAVLTSSENGWAFDYFPDRDKSYGGFIYTVKFDNAKATVGSELAPGTHETSLYKLTNDNGPILSFDSYNSLMHFFATPDGNNYEAFDGDFEFLIMDVTTDMIKLRGNRTGNIMYMHRLSENPDDLIASALAMEENFYISKADGSIGDTQVEAEIDINIRYIDFILADGSSAGGYYLPTATGLRFVEPIEINGLKFSELTFDPDNLTYTGQTSDGKMISLTGILDPTYSTFEEYEGEYTLNYNGTRSISISLVPDVENNRYIIKGMSFNSKFEVIANYSKSHGCLEINSQIVGTDGDTNIWLAAWALDAGGNLTWATQAGAFLVKDPENPGTFNFTPNAYSSLETDSFILWTTTSSGSSIGQAAYPWAFSNLSTQLPRIKTIVKK